MKGDRAMSAHIGFYEEEFDGDTYSPAEQQRITQTTTPRDRVGGFLKKVVIYVTRQRKGQTELLVFEHRDHPAAGLQVPAGTVDPGELSLDAARRELFEESGLFALPLIGRIDVYDWLNPETNNLHRRHVYQFHAQDSIADAWDHCVSAGEEDKGLIFQYRWMRLADAERQLTGRQGISIGRIS
jgi:8-oxo-dGTP pyrophosphatase MutT (NUDIX family)